MKAINNGSVENSLSKHFGLITMRRDFYVLLNAMQIPNVSVVCAKTRGIYSTDCNEFFLSLFVGKYSEPLKSLLEQLSDKLSNSSIKRSTSYEPADVNNKRNPTMSK